MPSTQNIQILLNAEREAQEIVENARTFRKSRLNEATQEALQDIKQLTSSQSHDLERYKQELDRQAQLQLKQLSAEVKQDLEHIEKAFSKNLARTTEWIVAHVVNE